MENYFKLKSKADVLHNEYMEYKMECERVGCNKNEIMTKKEFVKNDLEENPTFLQWLLDDNTIEEYEKPRNEEEEEILSNIIWLI
ncbi:MAG TPA: hypothetical protein VIK14_12200 [Ignavibacteria bacterium]